MRTIYTTNSDELADWELDYLKEAGFTTVIIAYCSETYEGWGYGIGIKDDTAYIFSLGHCSCYGPCEMADERAEVLDIDGASIHSDTATAMNDELGMEAIETYEKFFKK